MSWEQDHVTRLISKIIIEFGGPNRLRRGETTASKTIRIHPVELDPLVIKAAQEGVCKESGWKLASIEYAEPGLAHVVLSV